MPDIKKLNITIVTYNWPPRNAIGTHRPYSWAKYWTEAGANVSVLTAKKQEFDAPLDSSLPVLDGVNVVEINYSGVFNRNRIFSTLGGMNYIKLIYNKFKRITGKAINPRSGWYQAAKSTAESMALNTDIIVSTFGPEESHLLGNAMKLANPKARWVADYRDLWSGNHLVGTSRKNIKRLADMEASTVGVRADLVTSVSDGLTSYLSETLQKESYSVFNGFEDVIRTKPAKDLRDTKANIFNIVHTGTIYQIHRDPLPLLKALKIIEQSLELLDIKVNVDFYGARTNSLDGICSKDTYTNFVNIRGHVSRERSLEVQRQADLLLLLETPDSSVRGVLTGKVFEYICSGVPIICVGPDQNTEIGQLLARTATGLAVGTNSEFISDILYRLIAGDQSALKFNPKFDEISFYTRKNQALRMLNYITRK